MRSHDVESPRDAIIDTGIAQIANPRDLSTAVVMITPRNGFIPFPGFILSCS